MSRIPISIYTDGSCIGNKIGCPGGWAAILVHPKGEKVISGNDPHTTNNRMELTAVIEGIRRLERPCEITIHADSTYVMMSRERWKKFKSQKTRKNEDLWDEFIQVVRDGGHYVHFQHVEAHAGHEYNERCDKLAKERAKEAKTL